MKAFEVKGQCPPDLFKAHYTVKVMAKTMLEITELLHMLQLITPNNSHGSCPTREVCCVIISIRTDLKAGEP